MADATLTNGLGGGPERASAEPDRPAHSRAVIVANTENGAPGWLLNC